MPWIFLKDRSTVTSIGDSACPLMAPRISFYSILDPIKSEWNGWTSHQSFFCCFAQGSTYRTVIGTRTAIWFLSSWTLCLGTVIYLIISSFCFNIILNNWFFQIQKKWSFHKWFFSVSRLLMDSILKHKMLFIITALDTIIEMLSVSDFAVFSL